MGYGGKILAAIAAGDTIGASPTADKDYQAFGPINPFLLFIGPSGNVCRAPHPGWQTFDFGENYGIMPYGASGWQGWNSLGTNIIAWGGNELVFTHDLTPGDLFYPTMITTAFCPYGVSHLEYGLIVGQYNDPYLLGKYNVGKSIPSGQLPASRGKYEKCWIQNGHYKKIGRSSPFGSYYCVGSVLTLNESAHLFESFLSIASKDTYLSYSRAYPYGKQHTKYWTLAELVKNGGGGGFGYLDLFKGFSSDSLYGGDSYLFYGGLNHLVKFDGVSSWDFTQDVIQHQTIYYQGRIYLVGEAQIAVGMPAQPNGYGLTPILVEGSKDRLVTNYAGQQSYVNQNPSTSEILTLEGGYKCPIKYNNRLLVLTNYGKLFEVDNGETIQIVDLKEYLVSSQFASGIYGGAIGTALNVSAYKCYGVQLGTTLHMFLNYRLGTGNGGVLWVTSPDLNSFIDKTIYLPNSGIIPPSGMTLPHYLNIINDYKFSGYNNFTTVNGAVSGVPYSAAGPATRCEPSGWIQASGISSVWAGSGTFYNCNYTLHPNQWDVPMYHGKRTKYISPTYTKEPKSFLKVGLQPTGVSFEGYRYNGVNNYHIFGVKDEITEKVHLFFSEDVLHNTDGDSSILAKNPPSQVLYYTLNSSNQWSFRNQFKTKRLSWVIPTDMHEPSILTPSGSIHRRYPYEDRVNHVVYQPVIIYDWPFFSKVNVTAQYSTNYGNTWHNATAHVLSDGLTNIDTGSLVTDPSGIVGKQIMFGWDYRTDLSNATFNWVQFRFRAVAS